MLDVIDSSCVCPICGDSQLEIIPEYDYDADLELYSIRCSCCKFTHIEKYSTMYIKNFKDSTTYAIYNLNIKTFSSLEDAIEDWKNYINSLNSLYDIIKAESEFFISQYTNTTYSELEEHKLDSLISLNIDHMRGQRLNWNLKN